MGRAPLRQKIDSDPPRVDGRSKEARAARLAQAEQASVAASARPDEVAAAAAAVAARKAQARQAQQRTPMREAARGRVVAHGHNGEVLTRKRTGTGDQFAIDPAIIPDGWDYQWNAISIVGNQEVLMDQNLQMAENGWRPVPASRHDGRYMPVGHSGSIIRGGQRLEERPKILSDEARAEDLSNARRLISDRNESLKLTGVKQQLGQGYEMSQRYRGTGGDIRMSVDHALDVPKPEHQIAGPDE